MTMSPSNVTPAAGLRGLSAGHTALCSVRAEGAELRYRGYDVATLAEQATFEEVAYLLLHGRLPNRMELDGFLARLQSMRALPQMLCEVLECIPGKAHPMDVLHVGCCLLSTLEPEGDFSRQHACAERMLALFPGIITYWYHYTTSGRRIATTSEADSIGAHFLYLLHHRPPMPEHERMMHTSLILYAEHEFEASTFAGRVCASTLSDMYSCIAAAIGTLRGSLHGGANEAAMAMLSGWSSPRQAETETLAMLARKQKVMGFGHAVYRRRDPRKDVIKPWVRRLAVADEHKLLFDIAERVEQVMQREKGLFANTDRCHACACPALDIPTRLFTPLVVSARVSGWAAHVMEQRATNRIIRPSADYTGPRQADWVALDERP